MNWLFVFLAVVVVLLGVFLLLLCVRGLRQRWISAPIFKVYRRLLPSMSQTERDALEAGTVWWEGDLFSGRPDWSKLLAYPRPRLSAAEQTFLDTEVEELCRLSSDWETAHIHHDLSPQAWAYIKAKGFLGMIIPKRYGGLEFSAYAHSQVVAKLASRSSTAAVSVMVPNSLGPAELLLHYGTEAQRDYYLPRLARGEEIPAFALTSPQAGSDAASIPDFAIVCKGMWQGEEVLGMRVTWEKRYITLGPICTLLGLAFRLYDPDHLLGEIEDIGITCALVPTDTPGVNIGRRHWPLNAVFQNGPNWGTDVFMPLDWIIGGPAMAGTGWCMLMECLAAGRSISLPASTTGVSKLAVRATGGYARVRSQFKTPIGKFEGIEEALTRMGGYTYMMDAARMMTAGAIDQGEKPSVVSAIVKYHVTDMGRSVINDAMDVLGGKGICLGPNNFMGRVYQQIPIGITVEGANILTRSLIIFGQGAIRCHPYVLAEMAAARNPNKEQGLIEFDRALWSHVSFGGKNMLRSLSMALSGSHFVTTPENIAPETRRYYQQLTRFSASFSFLTDVSMIVLGGGLKRREKLSARLGDILSLMYLVSATLKRYEDEGRQQADAPLMHWAIWDAMFKAQNAFEGVLANFPNRFVAWCLRRVIFPLGRPYVIPADSLGALVAQKLIAPSPTRERLTHGMYVPKGSEDIVGAIEEALQATLAAEPIEQRLRHAQKDGRIQGRNIAELLAAAKASGIIGNGEGDVLALRDALRDRVIRVDHFPQDFGIESTAKEGA